MKLKHTSLVLGLFCAGAVMAAEPAMTAVRAELRPGERRALPVTHFGGKVEQVNVAVPEGVEQQGSPSRPSKVKSKVGQADPALFEGRTLYGGLISSQAWEGQWVTDIPYGVYSFTIGDNPAPEAHITDMGYGFKASAWGRDNYYGVVPLSMLGVLMGSRHIQIDTKNWTETSNVLHDSSEGTYSLILCSMAYDPTDDTFYGFRYHEDLSGLDWVKVNPETSSYEMIAAYRGKTVVLTLAPTPDGKMFYIDVEGDLYSINKETGRNSLIGNTGVTPVAYDQCMVYDNRSGSFLWAALSSEGSVLYSVNPETAETKRVMKFKNDEQFIALYTTDSDALPDAPAAVGRPQLKYSADGALDGAVTFTAPSKTFSGTPLDGSLNLDVWLDGENLKGVDVVAGSSVNVPVSLEEGNHYICITTSNDAGWSPVRYIYQYAGYDTPIAPANARLVFSDDVNSVSWDVPEGGVNKGYVDFDNLVYNVVRMPDNVEVAAGLKATSFSEPTPDALQAYYYVITAINNGHVSEKSETNRVLCGDAFPVPYMQSFEEESIFNDFFKVVDNNNDGNSWRYGYSGEIRMDFIKNQETPCDADEWLILPKVSLENGAKYRFSMLMKTFTPNYPEDFEILVGNDPDDLASFKSIVKETDFTEIAHEFGDYTCDFLIDSDGDYNVAVRYCSKYDSNSSLMMVRNVGISKIGMADAPGQVTDMTVTPDASDLLEATIAFKAPEVTLVDEPLSSITRITVLRDSEETPVHVFESVSPGQELSWTDTNVPFVGLHSYTVVPYNENGVGETRTEEEFIGIYTAPYSTDFGDKKYSQTLWTSVDNIEDDDNGWYGWSWTENAYQERYMDLFYFLTQNKQTDIWLFSPKFRLDDNTVYTINYNGVFRCSELEPDIKWQIAYGESASPEYMEKIEDLYNNGMAQDFETVIVNRDGGRYNIGYGVSGATRNDYFLGSLRKFSLTRRASAFAPCAMTDYSSVADPTGELKATLQFKTPVTDYYGDKLSASENLTVKIYQGKDATIPAYTATANPGEKVKWIDEKALHGFNYYRITCENSYGPGEVVLDTLFVGRDKPAVIENLSLKADAENSDVRLSWSKPEVGENGGLVLDAETGYNVYAYNPETKELTPIAENITEKSYLVQQGARDAQQLFYYAVSAVNSEGEGMATASSIVLGRPYNLPFAESFANAVPATQLWQAIPMMQGATSAGVDNPVSQSYNGCDGPQDNDGGCAYFYNGYQAEVMMGALLVSPKIRLDKEGDNELSFWAYHYREPDEYVGKGVIYVAVSADDEPAEMITSFEIGGDDETGWTEHKVNLDKFKNSQFLSVVFMGMTPGWQDVLYVDNFRLNKDYSGVETVTQEGTSENGPIFDINGYRLSGKSMNQGAVIIRDGKKILTRRN